MQARLDRVLEAGLVHAADRRRDDVVEVLLAAAVPLHRVEAQLHGRDVVLAVGAADDLVDGALDGERRALDELGPVEQLEVAVEGAVPPRRHGDHVAELPVVLGRELDPLRVGDAPHDRRGHRAAEMAVELGQRDLAREGTRHARRIADDGRAGTSALSRRRAGAPRARCRGAHRRRRASRPRRRRHRRPDATVGRGEDHVRRPTLGLEIPPVCLHGLGQRLGCKALDRRAIDRGV